MPYKVRLTNRPEREAKIKQSAAASNLEQRFYDFRGQSAMLKVIRIEIGILLYRMENFRTFIDQTEYLIREHKPLDFFLVSQENESVQQLQHEILEKLARTGRSDSITPVIDVLKKEKQREPILITHSGVVVNGNRRLAAMRELFEEDRVANSEFSHVDCMVLPEDTTPDEIIDIEADLQAKPETKLDYDWIGDSQLINKLLDMGRTIPQISERLRRKDKEIKNSVEALVEANMYLRDWKKAEGEYSRVREGEQFFKDLPSLLTGKSSALQEASRVIAWTLFDNKEDLGGRIYLFKVAIGARAADVLDRVASDLGLPLTETQAVEPSDGFDVDLEEEATVSYGPVLEELRDPIKKDEAVAALIEACKGVVESETNMKSGQAALRAVTAAHSKLAEIDLSRASPETYSGIGKQLDAVITRATDLKSRLTNYQK